MKRWRINLEQLPPGDRPRFISALLNRLSQSLREEFPCAAGYQYEESWQVAPCVNLRNTSPSIRRDCEAVSWRITRGRFWGLQLTVLPEDMALRSLKVTIDGYDPILAGIQERVERFENLPGGILWQHFLFGILLLLAMAIILLVGLSRLIRLLLRSDILAATRQVETVLAEVSGSWPVAVPVSRRLPLPVIYALVMISGAAVTAACFCLGARNTTSETLKTAAYVTGAILGLMSFGMLVALLMTLLGFKVEL